MNIQLGVDVGSSTVARGVVSLVLGYLTNLVIEMAFLVQVGIFWEETAIKVRKLGKTLTNCIMINCRVIRKKSSQRSCSAHAG